MKQFPRS